ncbi:MAG: ATP-dependent sacrificial sulfur transferase LarE [Clostridiaceae bacterium]|nr:ATP-dependent sacrificial sulfur transferase LarE [Clostridiaceae bacterium]
MNLSEFFQKNPKVAIAFSGGVDSVYLLYVAKKYAQKIRAYFVKSHFQPQFELEDAKVIAKSLDVELEILELDILAQADIVVNDKNRCYYCKSMIFSEIIKQAKKDGFDLLLDGTNVSDDFAERPGMRALTELEVRSPLRESGLSKSEIRELSKKAGLPTADKPAYSCLATRIPHGTEITAEKLAVIEKAEKFLFDLGFTDFRVRYFADSARIQLSAAELEKFIEQRKVIVQELKKYFSAILLDLEERS